MPCLQSKQQPSMPGIAAIRALRPRRSDGIAAFWLLERWKRTRRSSPSRSHMDRPCRPVEPVPMPVLPPCFFPPPSCSPSAQPNHAQNTKTAIRSKQLFLIVSRARTATNDVWESARRIGGLLHSCYVACRRQGVACPTPPRAEQSASRRQRFYHSAASCTMPGGIACGEAMCVSDPRISGRASPPGASPRNCVRHSLETVAMCRTIDGTTELMQRAGRIHRGRRAKSGVITKRPCMKPRSQLDRPMRSISFP